MLSVQKLRELEIYTEFLAVSNQHIKTFKMSKTPRIVLTEENHKKRQHAAYMRQKRKAWTDQEIERNREQSKLRMRKRREKLKQEMSNQLLLGDTRQTRLAEQKELERKKLQAENKRKYRSQLSSQKKRRIREKDAAKKREKRLEMKEMKNKNEQVVAEAFSTEIPEPCSTEIHETSCSSSSVTALKKMVYRTKKRLPKSPKRYAAVVKGLVTCVTPNRKAALRDQGMVISPNAKKNLTDIFSIVKDVNKDLQGTSNDHRGGVRSL